jgi:hypothetical protein
VPLERLETKQKTSLAAVELLVRRYLVAMQDPTRVGSFATFQAELRKVVPHPSAIGNAVTTAFERVAAASDADAKLIHRSPRLTILPPWFGRLQSTYQLAVQLLAALVLALVFSRRRSRNSATNLHLGCVC